MDLRRIREEIFYQLMGGYSIKNTYRYFARILFNGRNTHETH